MRRDRLRSWVSTNLQTITFLGAYFVTTVVGNFIFASPIGADSLRATEYSPRFLEFPNTFTPGFWTLLLCPFVLTPVIVALTQRAFGPRVAAGVRALPEFGRASYALVVSLCFAFVIYRFWQADVARLFASGVDMASSMEARFAIRERVGFLTFVPLQALLPFLTLYAVLRWMASRELFWLICALVNFVLLSGLLVMTNMKWPVLLFYVGLVLTIFVYARNYAYVKAAAGAVLVFTALLGISSFVFRIVPKFDHAAANHDAAPTAVQPADHLPDAARSSQTPEQLMFMGKSAGTFAPAIVLSALNRMAVPYAYYYQVFTEEGPVCGGILAQARRKPACRPSEMIYTRIFGNNGFEHRGTTPLAVHISGYALGGWPVALLALVAGSVILGLFRAVPLDAGPTAGALVILGGLTGYHLSQIPGEGVILYEHGLLWILLLMIGYAIWRRVIART